MTGDFMMATDPFALFEQWFEEARASEINDPNAMTLATVDVDGLPDARIVLLKGFDSQGFVFFTNVESTKGQNLAFNPHAALVFHWKSLTRQVRVRGTTTPVTQAEADAYFASRARVSQIGAWASQQSQALSSRETLEAAVAAEQARFEGSDVPRPPHWSGFRIAPMRIEFWHDRPYRLHDRLVFSRTAAHDAWIIKRLYP